MTVADTLMVAGMIAGGLGLLALGISLAVALLNERRQREQTPVRTQVIDIDAEWRVIGGK